MLAIHQYLHIGKYVNRCENPLAKIRFQSGFFRSYVLCLVLFYSRHFQQRVALIDLFSANDFTMNRFHIDCGLIFLQNEQKRKCTSVWWGFAIFGDFVIMAGGNKWIRHYIIHMIANESFACIRVFFLRYFY